MATIWVNCEFCGALVEKAAGAVDRARRDGYGVYCNSYHAGLARRAGKSKAQKRAEKAAYDAEYRVKNRAMLKAKKAAYFQRTYDPERAAAERQKRMPRHVEYCPRPEYREYKHRYDLQRRASEFGDYAEVYTLLSEIEREIATRATRYEIMLTNGTLNKALRRKRDYAKTVGC